MVTRNSLFAQTITQRLLVFSVTFAIAAAASAQTSHVGSGTYLDALFADATAARSILASSFQKKSKTAVIYMCFNRSNLINTTLTALVASDGMKAVDLIISQDGGSSYTVDVPTPAGLNSLYIRHPVNLCVGQHHYFVKRFAFDIMGYDQFIVIEEDNLVHRQAVQLLTAMLDMSESDPEVGIVSITDMDNSMLYNETKYGAAVLRVDMRAGHLWVYGMHASRWKAIRSQLTEYYDVIKGRDYRNKHKPPLRDDIVQLHVAKGFPSGMALSQDAFVLHTLTQKGFPRRLTTLARLFEPQGWEGLHFRQNPNNFYGVFGKGMHEGRILGVPFEVSRDPVQLAELEAECKARLNVLHRLYLGRDIRETRAEMLTQRLLDGIMNAVGMVQGMVNTMEHRRRIKRLLIQKIASQ